MNIRNFKKPENFVFVLAGVLLIITGFIRFLHSKFIFLILFMGFLLAIMPFVINFFRRIALRKEYERRFLDFIRDLVSALKAGMPMAKSLEHVAFNEYGALSPLVRKLNSQVQLGIPLHDALITFAKSTDNPVIWRAVSTIIEAHKSGGKVEEVLELVTDSIYRVEFIKEKRRSTIQSQVLQSYIIFIVFLGLIIVIQKIVFPAVANLGSKDAASFIKSNIAALTTPVHFDFSSGPAFVASLMHFLHSLNGVLLMLAVIQAFFSGLVLGRLSEGDYRSGLKHSLIMMVMGILVILLGQNL